MRRLIVLAIAAFAALLAAPTHAQNNRSGVASYGSDANACTIAAPCLTLQGAIGKTNAGGEVVVLDSHVIGNAVVGKALSIVAAANADARIVVQAGGIGIDVDAGPNADVTIDGISFQGDPASVTLNIVANAIGILVRSARNAVIRSVKANQLDHGTKVLPKPSLAQLGIAIHNYHTQSSNYGIAAYNANGTSLWMQVNRFTCTNMLNAALLSDGTSNTLMCGECSISRVVNATNTGYGVHARVNGAGTNVILLTNTRITGTQTAVFGEASNGGDVFSSWTHNWWTHNDRAYGVNFVLGDGSVRFVSDRTNYLRLSGFETGDVIDADTL
jgi:hypothetical protein